MDIGWCPTPGFMDGEIGVRTKAIIVALLVCLSAPQLGCASVAKQGSGSTERAATAVKNKDKKSQAKKRRRKPLEPRPRRRKNPTARTRSPMIPRRRITSLPIPRSPTAREIPPTPSRIPAIRKVPAATIPLPTAVARRSGLPSRATGRQITARCGFRMWFIRVMSAGCALYAMQRLTQRPKWTIMLSLPTVMHNTLMELLQSMIRIPPLRTRDIMNSRLRDSIGLSTSPVTGSNVHRSSPLTFGKCLFICGRPVRPPFLDAQSGSKR